MKDEIKKLLSEVTGLIAQKDDAPAEQKSALEAQINEMKSSLENMEKQMYRVPAGSASSTSTDEVKSFDKFVRTWEQKYLRTDVDPDGGFLVPNSVHDAIINKVVEISDMRRLARVITIGGKSHEVDIRESDVSVFPVGEGGAVTQSAPGFGRIVIPAHKVMAQILMTREMLADARYDMVADINERAALKFAEYEGAGFIAGNGINRPQGIINQVLANNVASGASGALTADAFWDMIALMKYRNPTFIMNRATYVAARKLKAAGTGEYLLEDGLGGNPNMALGGIAGTIAGIPVVLCQDMPNVAANNVAVVLGDFKEAYLIVDRAGLSVVRDDYTRAANDQVVITMNRRSGGGVVNPDALVSMTINA